MNIDLVGRVCVWILAGYFFISGSVAAFDIDAKLARIGLEALSADGEIAFILIYSSLMVGIGIAMLLLLYVSSSWVPSLILAGTIILSFIIFRLLGSVIVGEITSTQIGYLITEIAEFGVLAYLLSRSGTFCRTSHDTTI